MKNKVLTIIMVTLLLLCSNFTSLSANASVSVTVDGNIVKFDVAPKLIGGRTMVPLRAIFEALGATVTWDEGTQTITAYNEAHIVKCTIGSNTMYVNNVSRSIDVAPMIVESRTLVPARFVAEGFGCDVTWNPQTLVVAITSADIDYSSVEQPTGNTSSNQSNTQSSSKPSSAKPKVSYYSGTTIPTYIEIVGRSLIDAYYGDDAVTYSYKFNKNEFIEYIYALINNYGWTEDENVASENSLTYYLIKQSKLFSVSYMAKYDEVWITILYQNMSS